MMTLRSAAWLLVSTCTPLVLPASAHAGEAEKVQIREIVRDLGYGGAIHNLKNYVLRGEPSYRADAEAQLAHAAQAIAALRGAGKLADPEKEALDAVELVVQSYQRTLALAQKLVAASRKPEEVDQAIKIADSPAIWGLEVLRKGQTWSGLENLEHKLGFGGAIHNFKNYVLRGSSGTRDVGGDADAYRKTAEAQLKDVEKEIAALEKDPALAKEGRAALKDIGQVMAQYQANLPKVRDLIAKKKSAREIDAAVKVDDHPATAGLAVLRKK